MTRYVRNEEGTVHSVTDEHFEQRLHTRTNAGRSFLLPGWTEVDEKTARKEQGRLFGEADSSIVLTDDELVRALQRKKMLAELHATD